MKIGIICYPTVGGSGVVATELGHALANNGHQVHFITYEVPFRLRFENSNIFFHQVELYQYDLFYHPDYALSLAVKISEISKAFDLDILHVHYAIPHATSAFLAKQILNSFRPVVITTLHGTDITLVGRDPAYYPVVKFSIEQSAGVTSVSQSLKKQTIDNFSLTKDIEVIYNFFTPKPHVMGTKPFHAKWAPNGEKILLHSSNFRHVKRVSDVLKIFLKVRKQINSKLVLLGTGPAIEDARQIVHDYNLSQDVIFLGKTLDVDSYISSADLFLLPSSQESFGLAALEAMAYGVPVIASDVGGLPEVIVHGKTGFLVPVEDVDTMAALAVEILKDSHAYAVMSKEAIHHAASKFSLEKILPQYEAFYNRVLEVS